MKRLLLVLAFLLVVSMSQAQVTVSIGSANLHAGKIGLGLDGINGSPNILLKYFFSSQLAGQLVVGFDLDSPGGTAPVGQKKITGTTFRGGISILYHLSHDQLSPYLGGEAIFQTRKDGGFFTTELDAKNSITGGLIMGAEYFLNDRFTLGIKQILGAAVQLKRTVPKEETDIQLNTSTLFTGRFYFN